MNGKPQARTIRRMLWITLELLLVISTATPATARAQGTSGPIVSESRVGYIDGAIPGDQVRFRYDAAYDFHRPTRAEFFWPKSGPLNPGPPKPETSVDYQDLSTYVEKGFGERFSAFVELPARFVNPTVNDNNAGLGDMNAGFKYAFLREDDLVATFQFRTFIPTGDARRGFGNDHVSLEPALLLYKPLTERLGLEAEFRTWISVGGTNFAGDLVRYGVGVHYDAFETCQYRFGPVAEFVGWTVLDGKESVSHPAALPTVHDASGETIVNVKLGLRFQVRDHGDVYAGYGRPLTGDKWYVNTFRVEFRLFY